MKIGTKITASAIGAVTLSVIAGLFIQRNVIRSQGIELTRNTMRAAMVEAENVRDSIGKLNKQGAFDVDKLLAAYKKNGDLRNSTVYQTIPVVAAWNAIEQVAKQEGFDFRVPKNQARNPKNTPTADEAAILRVLEDGGAEEYFKVDSAKNEIVYARPIKLSSDCMLCHGDPKNSPTGDGKDVVGFPMEGWSVGQTHGAFVLKCSLERVDKVVHAGVNTTLSWIVPLAVLIGVGFYFLNRYLIVRPLNGVAATLDANSNETAAAAQEVSSASQTLAEGASEQAASLEETSASLEEMSSMTKRNADNAQDAKSTAVQTRQSADAGAEQMQSLLTAMDSIKTASEDITKILRSIDEIAFQTNILALNAAVEAARAGEAGAGFAVVADEVRNLAQRCAAAAKETAVKIEDSVKKSQEGAKISADVARSFTDIQTKVRQLDQLVAEIASASQEQSQGISQVNIAVTQMDKVTQSNAASAEESASASEELNAQAESLKDAVSTLQQLLDGTTTSQARERVSLPPGRSVHPKGSRSGASARLTLPNHGGQHSESARSAPTRDSGAAVLTSAKSTGRGGEIPMDGDFKNF